MRAPLTTSCLLLLAVLSLCVATGCEVESECEAANTRMCDLACDCTAGAECLLKTGAVEILHDNRADCVTFWATFGCDSDEADTVDWAACEIGLNTAQCVDTGDGTMALEIPTSCDSN